MATLLMPMTDSPTDDISIGFRASVIELLETLSSKALQEQYQEEVPIADVSAELNGLAGR